MKKRVDAGTDVAMIGAWDASRNDSTLAGARKWYEILEREAAEGGLFYLRTGGDCGGAVDVFVDEAVSEKAQLKRVGKEYLLSVPSGRLVIDGGEFYRTGKEKEFIASKALEIPAGDYALRCYVSKSESGINPPSRADLDKAVGVEDSAYYRRRQWAVLAMYVVVPVLFFVVRHFRGWRIGLLSAVALAVVSFLTIKMLSASGRFKRTAKANKELWERAQAGQEALFVFELRKKNAGEELKGGWIHLEKEN